MEAIPGVVVLHLVIWFIWRPRQSRGGIAAARPGAQEAGEEAIPGGKDMFALQEAQTWQKRTTGLQEAHTGAQGKDGLEEAEDTVTFGNVGALKRRTGVHPASVSFERKKTIVVMNPQNGCRSRGMHGRIMTIDLPHSGRSSMPPTD